MASGVLGVLYPTHRKRKRLILPRPITALASALSLFFSAALAPHSLLSSLDQDWDGGWLHQHAVGSLASTSALRGERLDSLLDRHPPLFSHVQTWQAHCGRQHVGACEQGLHSDGVLLQNGGRQMQQGLPESY